MRRRGIAAAILIFILAFIVAGLFLILMDTVVNDVTTWRQTYITGPGIYDSNILTFFNLTWIWFPVIVLVSLSVWLYLRAQERDDQVVM